MLWLGLAGLAVAAEARRLRQRVVQRVEACRLWLHHVQDPHLQQARVPQQPPLWLGVARSSCMVGSSSLLGSILSTPIQRELCLLRLDVMSCGCAELIRDVYEADVG